MTRDKRIAAAIRAGRGTAAVVQSWAMGAITAAATVATQVTESDLAAAIAAGADADLGWSYGAEYGAIVRAALTELGFEIVP